MKNLFFLLPFIAISNIGMAQETVSQIVEKQKVDTVSQKIDTTIKKKVDLPKNLVKIWANIENRNGDYIYINTSKTNPKKIKVDRTGYFTDTLMVAEGFYQMYDGKRFAEIYLAKDFDLTIIVDNNSFDKTLSFSGVGAVENNYLATQRAKEVNYDFKEMMNLDEASFKFAVDKRVIAELRRLGEGDLNAKFAQTMTERLGAMVVKFKDYYAKLHGEERVIKIKDLNYSYINNTGDKVSISDFLGSFVFIQVWATNSVPSDFESQYLREIIRKYEPQGINFVSIAIDPIADIEKWKTVVDDKGLTGNQLIADAGWKSKIVTDFNITSVPRYILLGKDGKLLQPEAPRPSSPNLRAGFEKLLSTDFEEEERLKKEAIKKKKSHNDDD